jgi:uncharacterized protein with beta-barrel porin domain
MRPEEGMDLAYRQGYPLLRLFPGKHAHFRSWRQHRGFHGNRVGMRRGRFAWAHDFNTDRSIGATFQTLPGASFVVNGAAQAHDAALTTASAELKWRNGWSAATFEGEFSDVTRSYAGKGVVRYTW